MKRIDWCIRLCEIEDFKIKVRDEIDKNGFFDVNKEILIEYLERVKEKILYELDKE